MHRLVLTGCYLWEIRVHGFCPGARVWTVRLPVQPASTQVKQMEIHSVSQWHPSLHARLAPKLSRQGLLHWSMLKLYNCYCFVNLFFTIPVFSNMLNFSSPFWLKILWQSPNWGSQCFNIPFSPIHTLSRLTVDSRERFLWRICILFTRLTKTFSHSWPDPMSVPVWMHLRVNVFAVLKALCSGVTQCRVKYRGLIFITCTLTWCFRF